VSTHWGEICPKTGEFRVPWTVCLVLYPKYMQHHITYHVNLNCKKPKGGPLLRSRDALLGTPDQTRMVVFVITIYTDLLILNFGTHVIYTYINPFLKLQPTRLCICCVVGGEFSHRWPQSEPDIFPRSLPHLGRQIDRNSDTTQNHKNSFIGVFYGHKLYIHCKY